MPVYVDRLRDWNWKLGPSCHLVADTLDELHAFALRIGLQRQWFQEARGRPHYDLTAGRRARAVELGAVELDDATFVAKVREIRRANQPEGGA